MSDRSDWKKETLAIAAGRPARVPGTPINVPPMLATSFHAGAERSYARDDGTQTWEALEDVLGALEGGRATVFASGMAAVAAVFANAAYTAVVVPTTSYAGVRPYARDYATARSIPHAFVDITARLQRSTQLRTAPCCGSRARPTRCCKSPTCPR